MVSCENVLRMAGLEEVTEQDIVDYAANTENPYGTKERLCVTDSTPGANGGTNCLDRQVILNDFGVSSGIEYQSVDTIAKAVESGRGVIISVDAGKFYDRPEYNGGGHAVTVTSVRRGPDGELQGFYICDSNSGVRGKTGALYVEAAKLDDALDKNNYCNITTDPIR